MCGSTCLERDLLWLLQACTTPHSLLHQPCLWHWCRYDRFGKSAVQSSTSSANSRAGRSGTAKQEQTKRHDIVTIALLPAGDPAALRCRSDMRCTCPAARMHHLCWPASRHAASRHAASRHSQLSLCHDPLSWSFEHGSSHDAGRGIACQV